MYHHACPLRRHSCISRPWRRGLLNPCTMIPRCCRALLIAHARDTARQASEAEGEGTLPSPPHTWPAPRPCAAPNNARACEERRKTGRRGDHVMAPAAACGCGRAQRALCCWRRETMRRDSLLVRRRCAEIHCSTPTVWWFLQLLSFVLHASAVSEKTPRAGDTSCYCYSFHDMLAQAHLQLSWWTGVLSEIFLIPIGD
jgi:hypothetical protein